MSIFYIGYIGKMGSGKDTVAYVLNEKICSYVYTETLPFAYALKKDLASIGVKVLPKTPELRILMQSYGTYRRSQDPDYWIKRHKDMVDDWIKLDPSLNVVIHIPDIRFKNETEYVLNNGGILIDVLCDESVRVERLKARGGEIIVGADHESETELENHSYDTIKIDNNGDIRYTKTLICNTFTEEFLNEHGLSKNNN